MAKARKTKGAGRASRTKRMTKAKPRPKRAAQPAAKPKARAKSPQLSKSPKVVKAKALPRRGAEAPASVAKALPVELAAPVAAPARPLDSALRADVNAALERNGYHPPEAEVVDVVTAVAAGYRQGPADAPPSMADFADRQVAEAFAEIYATGDLSPIVGRRMARPVVRATIDFDLRQLGPADTGDAEREILMGLCLGLWDPDRDTFAQRDGLAAFVCRWYRAGLKGA